MEYIEGLSDENKEEIVKAILNLSNPEDDTDKEENDKKIDYWVGLLISKGHTNAYDYHIRFFRTCMEIVFKEDSQEMARFAIARNMDMKAIKEALK